jgi:hypothetical protein
MDGRTFRYHDNHEFFRSPTAIGDGKSSLLAETQTVARKRPKIGGQPASPSSVCPGEHHRHCTAGEIAKGHGPESGYAALPFGSGGGFGMDLRSPLLSDAGCS